MGEMYGYWYVTTHPTTESDLIIAVGMLAVIIFFVVIKNHREYVKLEKHLKQTRQEIDRREQENNNAK